MENIPRIYYEYDINLRERVKVFLRYKWLILGLMIIAAITGWAAGSFLLPKKYLGSATVVVTRLTQTQEEVLYISRPWMRVQFVPRIPDGDVLEVMAIADDLVSKVDHSLSLKNPVEKIVRREGRDAIILDVYGADPEVAAEYANLWAQEYAEQINTKYNVYQSLIKLEEHVETAYQDFDDANESLENALVNSKIQVLEAQLDQANDSIIASLTKKQNNIMRIEQARVLDSKLELVDKDNTLSDGQIILVLELLRSAIESGATKIGDDFLIDLLSDSYTASQARHDIVLFIEILDESNASLDIHIKSIEGEIVRLSQNISSVNGEIALYSRQRDLAIEDIAIMEAQLFEAYRLIEFSDNIAEITARAQVADSPESPNVLGIAILAPSTVLVIAIMIVYIGEWWHSPLLKETEASATDD